jgi:hypothetical protein
MNSIMYSVSLGVSSLNIMNDYSTWVAIVVSELHDGHSVLAELWYITNQGKNAGLVFLTIDRTKDTWYSHNYCIVILTVRPET